MSTFKFNERINVEEFLLESLGDSLIIPNHDFDGPDVVTFFHNGDIMKVDVKSGVLDWDTIHPGELGGSRLSLRIHQWFGKGIIIPVKEE